MNRKELKQLIREHKIKQICSMPAYYLVDFNVHIIYKDIATEELYSVIWSVYQHKAVCNIDKCTEEYLEKMQQKIFDAHHIPEVVEQIHKLYNECTDYMLTHSATMNEKMVAKYIRKSADFFIHDRRFHV